MTHNEIRKKFLAFFEERAHTVVPSSSLLPDDPSVLFTTAGMQQFKPYYTGNADARKDFGSLNTASIQKSIRTSDIDEVGDHSHLTFFEMLGNFSFGGYFKKEAITWAHEFITEEMGLTIDYVSVFGGEGDIPADEESEIIWKTIDKDIEVKRFGREDNFWGPTGDKGPCGPTTEIYVDGIEVWNIVFNEFFCNREGSFEPMNTKGIDTGMGLERLALVSQFPAQKDKSIFDTDLYVAIMRLLPADLDDRVRRIIGDHIRATAFLISDGVRPSNKEQGYVLRRLMRRAMVHEHLADEAFDLSDVLRSTIREYQQWYPNLDEVVILDVFETERDTFSRTLKRGLKEMDRLDVLDAESAFRLYESFGLPYEVIKELGGGKALELTREDFDAKFKEHQEKSRAGAAKKFGGHGLILDTGEIKASTNEEVKVVTRLHTATHLLHAALRTVLGEDIKQAGSDITAERLRFDFTFPRKLTMDERQEIEELVNEVVQKDLPVHKKTMPLEKAKETGALFFFKDKYPDEVDVYFVGETMDEAFSKEFCGGPHVTHTGEIGKVTILKEEAVGAGARRIRARVE